MQNFGLRESAVVPSRTLVAADGHVWIWPGIALTKQQGEQIVAKSAEEIRFWITRWHGPEALYTDAVHCVSEAAHWLTRGNESAAQRMLDRAGLKKVSLDGAALMKRVAGRLGLPPPDFECHQWPRLWTEADIDLQVGFVADDFDSRAPLEKFIPFDSSLHPRWDRGAPDSQGGRFKDKDGSDAAVAPDGAFTDKPPSKHSDADLATHDSYAIVQAAATDTVLTTPNGFSYDGKIRKQMVKRGWTAEQIDEAVAYGPRIDATNKYTGAPATRYVNPTTGQSVVIDNTTNEVVMVGGPDFEFGPESGDVPGATMRPAPTAPPPPVAAPEAPIIEEAPPIEFPEIIIPPL